MTEQLQQTAGTAIENAPSSTASPQGRRVLVALVGGELGERIQRWREQYDPEQALRIPPHTTLCYWLPEVDLKTLGAQVRHAFAQPVTVRLGEVREFDNDQHTFYVAVEDTSALDEVRRRLYDGTHVELPGFRKWTWHVTCVRESLSRDLAEIRRAAAALKVNEEWHVDTVACLELQGTRYVPLATWSLA